MGSSRRPAPTVSLRLGLVGVVASHVQWGLQLRLIEAHDVRRLLVDQFLHRLLLVLRVEAPHVKGD
jgi:hypothetical protein